ncbi:MAG: hemolysin family protein [Pseudomonadota bacterium]|nr:hemolysin family protein [Pseudomonadota bacterium]
MPLEVLILLGLITLNGVFAMSEIALVTARRARLQVLMEEGDRGAAAAMALNTEPTRFLSTIQVGITSIGITSGIVGEAAFATPLSQWLIELGGNPANARLGATVLVVLVITYVSIVIGELVPKRLGQIWPEAIARRVARPIGWLATAARPFVRLLSSSTDLLLRLFGARNRLADAVTEEEIHALIQEGSDHGVIDEQERAMVRNVFRLDDRQIASLMTPRSDIVYVDLEDSAAENLNKVIESQRSRFPVCRGGLRDVIGIMSASSLLQQTIRGQAPDFSKGLVAAAYVPESLTGMELLETFRTSTSHQALVVDEYGEIQGLVTLQDLLEAITGEFKTPSVDDSWAVQRQDGSWLLDGLIPLPELKDRLGFAAAPEEELGRYNTLSGMVMLLLGRVPHTGDIAKWQGWQFEIVDMDKHRIDKVLASLLPEKVKDDGGAQSGAAGDSR